MSNRDPWTEPDAEALRAAIGRFVRTARRHDALPRTQAAVLGHLDRDGPLSIAALAERVRVRHQSMRETVQLLADMDALTRSRSAQDARVVTCSITASGRTLLDADRHARTSWILAAINGQLAPGERAAARKIADLLERIAASQHDDERDDGAPATT